MKNIIILAVIALCIGTEAKAQTVVVRRPARKVVVVKPRPVVVVKPRPVLAVVKPAPVVVVAPRRVVPPRPVVVIR